jgi:Fanconi anemia group M protein
MVVEGLPGVSAVRARALLRHFRTLRNLFNASVERLMEVEGVGRKTAEKIYEVANLEYED